MPALLLVLRITYRAAKEPRRDTKVRRPHVFCAQGNKTAGTSPAFVRIESVDTKSLVVAIDPLAALMALLRLDRQRRDRAGFEALQGDRLAGLLAVTVGAVLEALQRGVDLGDQFALAVARAQFDRAVGLGGGAVGEIGVVLVFVLQVLQRFPASRRISSFQMSSLARKYWRWRSFMKGSFSVGR